MNDRNDNQILILFNLYDCPCLAVSLPDVFSDSLGDIVVHVHELIRVPKDEAETCA